MGDTFPIYLGGEWATSDRRLDVKNPYNDEVVGTTFLASPEQLDAAIQTAESAFCGLRRMPTFDRVTLLKGLAAELKEQREELIQTVALEEGKPVREAEIEVDRGAFTLETAAEEAKRI